jgi:NADH:ubiquinone oxidoreductase subunit B-like Fe-S oxidoreductase
MFGSVFTLDLSQKAEKRFGSVFEPNYQCTNFLWIQGFMMFCSKGDLQCLRMLWEVMHQPKESLSFASSFGLQGVCRQQG